MTLQVSTTLQEIVEGVELIHAAGLDVERLLSSKYTKHVTFFIDLCSWSF